MAERKRRSRKKVEPKKEAGGNGVSTAPVFAEDAVLKLTEPELDKFNLLAMKAANNLQQIRVLELEQERADRNYVAEKHSREQHIKTLRGQVDPLTRAYENYVHSLAKKYKIQPQYMGIDDETGVIRDLTPQEEAGPG